MTSVVDAVVVNYRTTRDLRRFCDAWQQHAPETSRLIIVNVDPHPTDSAYADSVTTGQQIQHLAFHDNVGYARACNAGIDYLGKDAPVVAAFNADTAITDGLLDELLAGFEANREWGIVGPRQIDSAGRLTHCGIFGTNTRPAFGGVFRTRDNPRFHTIRDDAVSVAGSAYLVRRDTWDDLTACPTYREAAPDATGAFLPTRHYYEDMWCSLHARAHGWKVVYYGAAAMLHDWHQASPVGGWADKQMPEARDLFRRACDLHGIPRE